jgi:hypothetical protein
MRMHQGRKGERRSMSEAGYAGLIAAAHRRLQARDYADRASPPTPATRAFTHTRTTPRHNHRAGISRTMPMSA